MLLDKSVITIVKLREILYTVTARILIVDDVLTNSRLLQAKLNAEYYQIMSARDGFEALELAGSWQPDLILLDIMMPRMDGYECCYLLKHNPTTSHIPIIMITALGELAERLRGLEAGADDFLTKPVEHITLMVRIRSLIRLKRILDELRSRGDNARSLGLTQSDIYRPNLKGVRAVIIDDWDQTAQLVQRCLSRDEFVTIIAKNLAQSANILELLPCDLFIVNLSLLAVDALRLISIIRASNAAHEIPLLLLSDESEKDRMLRGLDLGASDWLFQPVDEHELLLRSRNLVRRKLYQDHLRSDVGTALELALLDPLTGLYNRRYIQIHLGSLCNSYNGNVLSLLMVDVDKFKLVNDMHGHASGDRALRMIANVLREEIGIADSLARYGGEEFLVIMPDSKLEIALIVAEKIRAAIEFMEFFTIGGVKLQLTVSIGVAYALVGSVASDVLLHQADVALYEAKRNGRNQVELYRTGT